MAVYVDPCITTGTINPKLHGQFIEHLGACIDDGIWVGEDSAVEQIKGVRAEALSMFQELEPPVIRWPGGCYADIYHWREGVGARYERPVTYNDNFATNELDRHGFGTDEFLRLCEEISAEPWININLMTGTVQEMRDWMEYCMRGTGTNLADLRAHNGHAQPYVVPYWGIGNEVWCGGGSMTARGYVDSYRRYASSVPGQLQTQPRLILSGPDGNKPKERVAWTIDVLREFAQYRQPEVWGYDLHFYNWNVDHEDDTSMHFDGDGWNRVINGCMELEDVIDEQWHLLQACQALIPAAEIPRDTRAFDIQLVVGEWGNWHRDASEARPALRQQVTMRDAITTALTLDILQRNCDKVAMACNAQTVNVLNSLLLTDGSSSVRTANFDVFMMYKNHRGAQAIRLPRRDEHSGAYVFASVKDETILFDAINPFADHTVNLDLRFADPVHMRKHTELSASKPCAYNDVDHADDIRLHSDSYDGDLISDSWTITLNPASVNTFVFAPRI